MVGLDFLPPSINLWRCELNWIGGMGIIVLAVAILPMLGVGGMQLLKAEVPGPIKDTKLTARIADTAAALWIVYLGITVACIVALRLAGMSWFDGICHAFAALSLGGFSTRDASVGAFHSPAIEVVLIVFMVLAALNFATHFTVYKERSLRPYWRDPEARAVIALIAVSCFGCGLYLWMHHVYPDFSTSLRRASFNLVSIATDCGFASVDFGAWPIFVPFWMLFLSCITVSSGSTGGGVKMIRTLILTHQSSRELSRLIHPSLISPLTIGGTPIPNNVVFAVLGFSFLYAMSVVVLTFLLIFGGLDFISALSAVVACINNAGPGLGRVGPAQNYASLNDYETWVCAFTMLLGRLELFSLLILFTPQFWRK
jgi:trk system potassium uptake protein TrkH